MAINPGLIADFGTSIDTVNTITWMLEFRYTNFCTNFSHHPASSSTFTGNARLQGNAVQIGTGPGVSGVTTQSLGPAPDLVMSLSSAIYTIIGTTTSPFFLLAVSNVPQSLYPGFASGGTTYSTFDATFAAQSIQFTDQNTIQGLIHGEITSGGTSLGSNNVGINLTRGGSCPV